MSPLRHAVPSAEHPCSLNLRRSFREARGIGPAAFKGYPTLRRFCKGWDSTPFAACRYSPAHSLFAKSAFSVKRWRGFWHHPAEAISISRMTALSPRGSQEPFSIFVRHLLEEEKLYENMFNACVSRSGCVRARICSKRLRSTGS